MLATRQFTHEDQLKFAAVSGDYNPMHMDSLAARRTQAGAPVVHGVHSLLWLIETLARHHPDLPSIVTMNVSFTKMVYIGEHVEAKLTHRDEATLRAEGYVDGMPVVTIRAVFGRALPPPLNAGDLKDSSYLAPSSPLDLSLEDMEGRSGKVRLSDIEALAEMFPHAARYLGNRRIAALACSSYLVGMVVPGLHSIYGGLSFGLHADSGDDVVFKVTSVDSRFRLVNLKMIGGGLSIKLQSFVRLPPVQQADMKAIAPLVAQDEFATTTTLIVGGSRGLGELTAKIIAAGGGKVIITYACGKTDAENVAAEITAWDGACKTIRYNVLEDAGKQLATLSEKPSHLYYFATPPLMSGQSEVFSKERYKIFCDFYVAGFEQLVKTILKNRQERIDVFYPSSVAIDEQKAGMIEYAKAKAEGERLCSDLMTQTPGLHILTARLPRMLTDLTATLSFTKAANPLETLLPIIRKMQGRST